MVKWYTTTMRDIVGNICETFLAISDCQSKLVRMTFSSIHAGTNNMDKEVELVKSHDLTDETIGAAVSEAPEAVVLITRRWLPPGLMLLWMPSPSDG